MEILKRRSREILRWSEKYTKTDMAYVARGGGWLAVGKFGDVAIAFVLMVALANWLSEADLGTYQYVLSVTHMLIVFTLPGMSSALIRTAAHGNEGALAEAFSAKLRFGFLGALAILGIAGYYLVQANYTLGVAFIAAGIFFAFQNASSTFGQYWIGKKRFDLNAIYRFASALLSAAVIIPTIYFTNNIVYLVLATFASNALFDFALYQLTKSRIENTRTDPDMVPYAKSLTVMGALKHVVQRVDHFLLWHFLGPVQVATYTFAILPINKVTSSAPIGKLALPKLSEKSVKERKRGILDKFWRLLLIFAAITVAVIVTAPLIYPVIFPQYIESIPYLQALSLLILFAPIALLGSSLTAEMKKKELYILNIASPLIKIALLLALIPLLGIWGAVIALITEQVVRGALNLYFFLKI